MKRVRGERRIGSAPPPSSLHRKSRRRGSGNTNSGGTCIIALASVSMASAIFGQSSSKAWARKFFRALANRPINAYIRLHNRLSSKASVAVVIADKQSAYFTKCHALSPSLIISCYVASLNVCAFSSNNCVAWYIILHRR